MSKPKYTYTFKNGDVVKSNLDAEELCKRMSRLDTLRVLTEGYEDGEGLSICKKAVKAYNKVDNFTGIIRLTFIEKEFLDYMLNDEESDWMRDEWKEVLKFYRRLPDDD